jgi:ribosomal-protein-alanine N-acetyltransferase
MIFEKMQAADVPDVLAIEEKVFPYPWSRGNFLDSIQSGYDCWVLRDAAQGLLGYVLLMFAVDEAHLLNVAVRPDGQGLGHGRLLIDKALSLARGKQAVTMFLEVRPSNVRALAVYQHYGFAGVGRRKAYYPAKDNGREDALILSLAL